MSSNPNLLIDFDLEEENTQFSALHNLPSNSDSSNLMDLNFDHQVKSL